MNIFLLGFMGSGKSATGRLLAERIHSDFIDLDRFIESKTEKTVAEIFEKEGEEAFRSYEKQSLTEVILRDRIVVALGGGTPCFSDNMDLINRNGMTFYLDTPADILAKRLVKSKTNRPLIRGKNEEELKLFINERLAIRNQYYLKAHYILQVKHQSAAEVAAQIEAILT